MDTKMSKQDLQWQAESDAHTMAQYQEIMQDKARRDRAVKEANKQAQNLSRRAEAMRSAASMKASSSSKANTARMNNRSSGRKH